MTTALSSANPRSYERDAQKWYVESFIDAGFEMRRHQCADAAMKVYGLSHRRSRQLYDLTLLEIRRALWEQTKHAPIGPARLRGTKGLPLIRYTNFLSREEFSKLAALMKDLAPSLVILVKPPNETKIRKRQLAGGAGKPGISLKRKPRGNATLSSLTKANGVIERRSTGNGNVDSFGLIQKE